MVDVSEWVNWNILVSFGITQFSKISRPVPVSVCVCVWWGRNRTDDSKENLVIPKRIELCLCFLKPSTSNTHQTKLFNRSYGHCVDIGFTSKYLLVHPKQVELGSHQIGPQSQPVSSKYFDKSGLIENHLVDLISRYILKKFETSKCTFENSASSYHSVPKILHIYLIYMNICANDVHIACESIRGALSYVTQNLCYRSQFH